MAANDGFDPSTRPYESRVIASSPVRLLKYMVAPTRIELVTAGYQPAVIPFNYRAFLGKG